MITPLGLLTVIIRETIRARDAEVSAALTVLILVTIRISDTGEDLTTQATDTLLACWALPVVGALYIWDTSPAERVAHVTRRTIIISLTATGHFTDPIDARGERGTVVVHATFTCEQAEPVEALLPDRAGAIWTALHAGYAEEVETALIERAVAIKLALAREDTAAAHAGRPRTTIDVHGAFTSGCTNEVNTVEIRRTISGLPTFTRE